LSFLTNQPDLSDTLFAAQSQYLQDIRDYLVAVIKLVAPEWLDNPVGTLGELWRQDEVNASCNLIWIATMLRDISARIDQVSLSRLPAKFKALLLAHEPKFSEYRAELEVGWYIASHVDSLLIEPLATRDGNVDLSNQMKSPDFAFEIVDTVYLEVTAFYVGILDAWQKAVDYIASSLQYRLLKKGRSLKLHLQLPLQAFAPKQSQKFDANQIIQYIWGKMYTDSGELTLTHHGKIRWEPYTIVTVQEGLPLSPQELDQGTNSISPFGNWGADVSFNLQDNQTGSLQITPFGVFSSPNIVVDQAAFVKEPDIISLPDGDIRAADELVLKSLKHKLKVDKRVQFPLRHQKPYLLAMKPGHYRLQGVGLFKLIKESIWSDDDFHWISGIILFTSRQGFKNTDASNEYIFFLNPNTVCPIDKSLEEKFQLGRKGHQTP
jgi:hypothetical protein